MNLLKPSAPITEYLVASDFDKTLSFNDSGLVLSEIMGVADFEEKVAGLAKSNLVQQGPSWPICCGTTRRSVACAASI